MAQSVITHLLGQAFRAVARAAGGIEKRFGRNSIATSPLTSAAAPWLAGGLTSLRITPETALQYSAAFACIQALATDCSLPVAVKRRVPGRGSVVIENDPRNRLVHCSPNHDTTSRRLRQALWAHRYGWGNGYLRIDRIRSGRWAGYPGALILESPRPQETYPARSRSGALWYVREGGRAPSVRAEDMIHVAGLGFDGLTGYSPLALHRQAVEMGLALQASGAAFFGNASVPAGVLRLKRKLSEEAKANLRASIYGQHGGVGSHHRLMILEEDMEFEPVSLSPEDALYIESRRFNDGEMNAIFEVPGPRTQHMADVANVYKAFEDLINAYVAFKLAPEIEGFEQEANRKLFTADELDQGYGLAHDFRALMRGNAAARAALYRERFATGSISPDEIREAEGDNPISGTSGDRYYVASQYVPIDQAGAQLAASAKSASTAPVDDQAETEAETEAENEDDT